MKGHVRIATIAFALFCAPDFAAAQTANPAGTNQKSQALTHLELTPIQKEMIFTAIRRSSVKIANPPRNLDVSIGAQVASSTELYALPDQVVADVPDLKSFRFTIVNNTLLLIDPASMRVVEIIR
jgi:hypothetical protein